MELNGTTPGNGYDQLHVNGTVTLGNASLSVSLGFTPAVGDAFTIINNDGTDAVTGAFSSLPEGAMVSAGTNELKISYVGGTGNDVVLTRISPATTFTSIMRLGNGHMELQATGGLSGLAYGIEAATNLNPVIQWTNIGTVVAGGGGDFSFTDTNAPLFPMRFYRAVSP